MKRACASILALCAAASAAAQDNVTVFGVLDTYLDHATAGATGATRVQSGGVSGSRLGFRGSEELGGGNRAIFMLESGINVDDGTSGQGGLLFGRQAWVGLATRAGDVTLGRHYSPLFFTLVTYGLGGGMGWGNASNYFTDNSVLRVNNSVSYASPSIGGFKVRALAGLGENTAQPGSHIGNIHSASLQYDHGAFSANAAIETRKTTAANTDRFYAAGASYAFGAVKASVLAQSRRDDADAARNDALELGLMIPVGPGSLLFDAGRLRNRSVADSDATAFSIRYDYNLSKRSTLYAGAATIRNETRSRFGINGNTGAALAVAGGDDPRSFVLGVRHVF
ncbi:porin [Massilia phosphatilytica]|nr:porin [Massilia phosphatilytica]